MNGSGLFLRFAQTLLMLTVIGLPVVSGQTITQRQTDSDSLLQTARRLYIFQRSTFMNREAFERELLKRPECKEWEMVIVRNPEEADLVLEVTRKKWTTRFTLSLVNPANNNLIASQEASSLGGEIEPKLAERFVRMIKTARARQNP